MTDKVDLIKVLGALVAIAPSPSQAGEDSVEKLIEDVEQVAVCACCCGGVDDDR